MAIVLLFLLAFPIVVMFLVHKHKKHEENLLPSPPGPRGLPIIGNLLQLNNPAPHDYLWQLSKKYGPLMSLRLGSVPTLVVSSARMAKEVYKTHDVTFSSRPSFVGQQKLSYNGLDVAFSPYNDYWREMRKICTLHLFTSKRAQSFRPIREEEVSQMVKRVSKLAHSSELANLSEIVLSLTSSIISRVAFGKRYDEDGFGKGKFDRVFAETQAMFVGFFFSDYFPLLGWLDKVTGMCARLDKHFTNLDRFYQELIDEHLLTDRLKSAQEEDIIDILLQLKNSQLSSFDLTFDNIKGVLMNMLIGGTETSGVTVVWAMTGLMQNPKAMKKAQEEVRKLIGKKGIVDEDDLQKLPYLKAVVKEAMRLYPPFPLLVPRETIQRCVIDGYEIQPKTLLYVNAWAIGRDPECWDNPDEFLPERFLGSAIDFKGKDFELIPFGAGRRGCPGIHLGAVTVELAVANLVYSFEWDLPDGKRREDIDTDALPGLAMHRKNGLLLRPTVWAPATYSD